jgi:hypothetical protein
MIVDSDATSACREAMALREWALHVLAGGATIAGAEAVASRPPAVQDQAWRLFLAREGSTAILPHVPGHLGAGAVEAARRSLAAKAQLRRIGNVLDSTGIVAVALKGGVAAAEGQALDLADLDLLVEPERALEVAALLEVSEGLEPVGTDSTVGGRGMTHLAPRVARGDVPVEIHFNLRHFDDVAAARQRALPLVGLPAIRRFTPPDHFFHLVVHCAIQHRERRGRIRDLELMRTAVLACTPAELDEVRARLSGGRGARAALALMGMAVALAEQRRAHDAFRRTAAAGYLLAARGRGRQSRFTRRVANATLALVEDRSEYLRLLLDAADPWELPSTVGWIAHIERRWPPLGRLARRGAAVGWTLLAGMPAGTIARRARRIADESAPGSTP